MFNALDHSSYWERYLNIFFIKSLMQFFDKLMNDRVMITIFIAAKICHHVNAGFTQDLDPHRRRKIFVRFFKAVLNITCHFQGYFFSPIQVCAIGDTEWYLYGKAGIIAVVVFDNSRSCLLYTSDAADE